MCSNEQDKDLDFLSPHLAFSLVPCTTSLMSFHFSVSPSHGRALFCTAGKLGTSGDECFMMGSAPWADKTVCQQKATVHYYCKAVIERAGSYSRTMR